MSVEPLTIRDPHLCLSCRTLLGPDQVCDHAPAHRVAALRDQAGYAAAMAEVWGPPSRRRQAKALAAAGGSGAGFAAIWQSLSGSCGGGATMPSFDGIIIGVILLVVAAIPASGWWLFTATRNRWRAYRNRLKPRGAVHRPAPMRLASAKRGRLVDGDFMLSPVTGAPCRGYALELSRRSRWGGRDVMLRMARTHGFTVALDDGDTLVVPEGRIRLRGPTARVAAPPLPWLDELAPREAEDRASFPLVPHTEAEETLLRRDDIVAVAGDFETMATEGGAADYRRQGPRRLRARGVVDVVVLTAADAADTPPAQLSSHAATSS
ncbi:MAG: hypothetical protein AAF928_18665 [Myxococcota bacterium]